MPNHPWYCLAVLFVATGPLPAFADSPNVILVFADDQGYQDLGVFGSPNIKTPHVDKMAGEGMRFTDFYSAASVCTPSRAALMTGCYPERVGRLEREYHAAKEALSAKAV